MNKLIFWLTAGAAFLQMIVFSLSLIAHAWFLVLLQITTITYMLLFLYCFADREVWLDRAIKMKALADSLFEVIKKLDEEDYKPILDKLSEKYQSNTRLP